VFEKIQQHARFKALLRKVNLPQLPRHLAIARSPYRPDPYRDTKSPRFRFAGMVGWGSVRKLCHWIGWTVKN
jgi:hypothetical protein